MTTVIDASIAVKAFVDEAGSDAARRLIHRESSEGRIIAPALLLLEFQGILTKYFAAGALSREQWAESSLTLQSLVRILPLDENQAADAITLSIRSMQLTAEAGDARPLPGNLYDCAYIVTALANNAKLVTADRRQAALAGVFGCGVRLLEG